MRLLRRFFLRSPEAVYRAYARWAGAQFVLHAFVAVLVMSVPAAITVFALTGSVTFAFALAPLLTLLADKLVMGIVRQGYVPAERKFLFCDAAVDEKLSLLAAPICRKASLASIPVRLSVDVKGEAYIETLAKDIFVIMVCADIWSRHTPRTLRGIIAHEVGHLCVPFQQFIQRDIDHGFLRPVDLCACYSNELSAECFRQSEKSTWKLPMALPGFVLRWLSCFLWFFSAIRNNQLNEYAADCYGAFLLGDALPLSEAFLNLAKHRADFGEEGEARPSSHPPLRSRGNRLLDINFTARHAS